MSSIQARRVFAILCFCMVPSAKALAGTLCVTDDSNNTIVLKTDSDFAAGAIVGLHGWLSDGTDTVPLHGTALIDSSGTRVKIGIQGINSVSHQYLGIAVDTDLMLNGSGTFEDVTSGVQPLGRPFSYLSPPVVWTALDSCPGAPPFGPSGENANVSSGNGTSTPPGTSGKN